MDLSALGDSELIARTIASGVGVPDMGAAVMSGAPADDLVAYLAARRMLLVLDNCEHLIDGCAALVDRLLAECPQVKVLATSRSHPNQNTPLIAATAIGACTVQTGSEIGRHCQYRSSSTRLAKST